MKAIYFANSNSKTLENYGKKAMNWSTEKLSEKFPKTSIKLSTKLLCTPQKRSQAMPDDFEVHKLSALGFNFNLYSKGESENAILFIHGWSGSATNFKKHYQQAIDQGYSVWAIDHVGHGDSEGSHANFFLFVQALRESFNFVRSRRKISAVVGHSMGASAIISAGLPSDIRTVLIAPVIPFFENMFDVITQFGISDKMLDQLITHFEEKFSMNRNELSPLKNWNNFKNPRLIFHDVNDQFIPLEENLKVMSKDDNLNMKITNGLGHFRILRDSTVIHETLTFIGASAD